MLAIERARVAVWLRGGPPPWRALTLAAGLAVGAASAAAEVLTTAVQEGRGLDAQLTCRDRSGRDIPLVKVANLGDVGRAWYINKVPVIAMDPHIAERLPDKLVRFFFDHECAHHLLGHWYMATPNREIDADCWAVTRARDRGELSREEIVSFAPFLAQSRGTPWGHPPGPERVQQMLFCFEKPLGG